MTLLIFILAAVGTGFAIVNLDFMAVIEIWIATGLVLFVWQTICDAGRAVVNALPAGQHEHYHLTQNRYDLSESDDPTKPNENIPAIIEIGRRYREKGTP